MLTPKDITDASRTSGYRHVGLNRGRWRAQVYRGRGDAKLHGNGFQWWGPNRGTPLEAAQDYCDWYNGQPVTPSLALKSAGHQRPQQPKDPWRTPEVEAALGVLRDARGQQQGRQGYVYLIAEDPIDRGLRAVKLGYSTKPEARVAELQTGNPRRLRLVAQMPGTEETERQLHAKYIKQNILQEWFRPSEALLSEFGLIHMVPRTNNERSATTP